MKKKITAICLIVCLAVVAIAGATMAYFTDSKSVNNTFTVGNVKIKLDEASVEKVGTDYVEKQGDRVTSNEYINLVPGAEVFKDPTVTNIGNSTAYVRVIVKHNNQGAIFENITANDIPSVVENLDNTALKLDVAWKLSDGTTGANADNWDADYSHILTEKDTKIYAFYYKLDPEESKTVFTGLKVPENWDNDVTAAVFGGLKIDVVAQAIQSEGFDDAQAAFAAFDAE